MAGCSLRGSANEASGCKREAWGHQHRSGLPVINSRVLMSITVSHLYVGTYGSALTTDVHKILHPTPKGQPQSALLPSFCFHFTNATDEALGIMGSPSGQREMSGAQQNEDPWGQQEQTEPGHAARWETHRLALRGTIFQRGSGRLLRPNRRLREGPMPQRGAF